MNFKIILMICITFSALSFFTYAITHALFTDTASATNNTFSSASVFPSPPTTVTPTLTPTITPSVTQTATPTPINISTHMVISEVQVAGSDSDNDFVELYNPANSSVLITGWKIRVRNSAGTESSLAVIPTATINPHSYYLWASTDNSFATSIGADTSNGNNLIINYSIALLTSSDVLVDKVAWGSSTSPFVEGSATGNPTVSGSIERKAYSTSTQASMLAGDATKGNGYDTDNNANDFVSRTTSNPQNSSSAPEIP